MNAHERILASLAHQEPDRVPFSMTGLTPDAGKKFLAETGSESASEFFQDDFRTVGFRSPGGMERFRRYHGGGVDRINDWGTGYVRGSMHHFEHLIPPLAGVDDIEEIRKYPLPDYTEGICWEHLQDDVARLHGRGLAAGGSLEMTLFEVAWQILGMDDFMVGMHFAQDRIDLILDRILELRLFMATKYVEAGVDVLMLGDDISTQRGMMMSPAHWGRFFKPRMKTIIEHARRINPAVHVFYHSDGDPSAVIPELIEIGIDVLNPVQPECMDPAKIKKEYGRDLSLFGTIGIQTILPFGSRAEVTGYVRERIETLKDGGGLVLAPTHVIEPEVPVENLFAMVEAVREYGRY